MARICKFAGVPSDNACHSREVRIITHGMLHEFDLCNEPIAKQDQYAAAFGRFNLIEFKLDDSMIVSPLICDPVTIRDLDICAILGQIVVERLCEMN